MLLRLLKQLQGSDYDPYVVELTDPGEISEQIKALGITVDALDVRRGAPNPLVALKVARVLRRVRPDVVQTWMYHADLIGGLAARLAGNPPVAWGLHSGNLSATVIKRQTLMTVRACARLSSRLPAAIVSCAESTRMQHVEFGYAEDKLLVIPNGFDLNAFRPDPEARTAVRRELGLAENDRLVGIVARFHPQKDHHTFVEMAGIVAAHRDDVHFLLAGDNMTWDNAEVAKWIDDAGIRARCHLLGRRGDMARIQASLDVGCLSSQKLGDYGRVKLRPLYAGGHQQLAVGRAELIHLPLDHAADRLRKLALEIRDRLCQHPVVVLQDDYPAVAQVKEQIDNKERIALRARVENG